MAILEALGVCLPAGAFRLVGGAKGVEGLSVQQIVDKYHKVRSSAGA